ncbi:MAG: helix-turn-helix transcriptional regulator [Solirubrobacteraceae bacterium]
MAAMRSVFVGRVPELASLSSALQAAQTSEAQIVWVQGEPGIGKTALVHHFLSIAEHALVLRASGDESETALEYGVVEQLLAQRSGFSVAAAPALAASTGAAERSVFSVGARVLAALGSADRRPTIVVVDDAHWADLSSAGALLFALRRLQADPVLALIVSRPDSLGRLGPSWLRLLNDPERVQRVRLSGLTGPDVSQLASSLGYGSVTVAAGERLRGHTDGHPLYIKALLSELPPATLTFDDGPLPAPRSFASTVLARLTNVSGDAQDLVAAAAVAGPRCELAFAAAVAGLGNGFAALAQARDADLLTLAPGRAPEQVTFTHPLVRAAVYDDLSPTRRRELHLACATLDPGPASLAHRVAASQGADDALAAELMLTAERDVAAGTLGIGAEHLLWASRIAASRGAREYALLTAAECLMLAGDVPAANGLRDAVIACQDGPLRSFVLGALTASRGRLVEAEAELAAVTAREDFGAHPELFGQVTSALGIVCAYLGRGADAVTWARQALDAPGNPPTVEVTAKQALTLGLAMSGRAADGIAELAGYSAARLQPGPFEAELITSRGNLKAWCGDLTGAVEDLSAVIRWSRAGCPLRSLPNAYGALADTEYRLGRWDDGLTHAEIAVSLGQDTDRAWDLAFVHAVAGQLHASRGHWVIAAEHVAAARRAAEVAPLPLNIYYASLAAAHLAWIRGDWDSLLAALAPLRDPSTGRVRPGGGPRAWGLLEAEALLGTGHPDEAERTLDELDGAMDESSSDVNEIELWRLRGALAQLREQPAQARAAFARGAAAASDAGSPFVQGGLELANGHFLRKTGNRRAAIGALRAARERFVQLGAAPLVARCDAELAACGVRSRAHTTDNHFGLTAREEVVARLVASGKSNRQVADELYVSTKAVEYHLGNVFAKVDVRSRHQLASRLRDPGGFTREDPSATSGAP